MDSFRERRLIISVKLNNNDLKEIIEELAVVFKKEKDYLNELDSKIGDGDHGLSMSRGFSAIAKYIQKNGPLNITDILVKGGTQFNEITGSTIGILIFSAMRAAGLAVKGKETVDLKDITLMFDEAIKAIIKCGKASIGQKTMLDSLMPSFEFLQKKTKEDIKDEIIVIREVINKAHKGAESTKQMESVIGRAKWFKNRSLGVLDPGAHSSYLIIKTIGDYLLKRC